MFDYKTLRLRWCVQSDSIKRAVWKSHRTAVHVFFAYGGGALIISNISKNSICGSVNLVLTYVCVYIIISSSHRNFASTPHYCSRRLLGRG